MKIPEKLTYLLLKSLSQNINEQKTDIYNKKTFFNLTNELVEKGNNIISYINNKNKKSNEELIKNNELIKGFLIQVEDWKIRCKRNIAQEGNLSKNNLEDVRECIASSIRQIDNDYLALANIMRLIGCANINSIKCANKYSCKMATTILRFLYPDKWGVVDWRTTALFKELKKYDYDIDEVTKNVDKQKNVRELYENLPPELAIEVNDYYRFVGKMIGKTPAEVDMAIYKLSFEIWT
ncbi:MAG: hypothetical protein U0354_20320 [Candidatus Sericytochromatia bacterium]